MATDVQKICDSLAFIHEMWASVVEVGLGVWLLYKEVGFAMFGPLIVTVVVMSGTLALTKRAGEAQKSWISGIQTRIGATSKILESMKGVKMLGLASKMAATIKDLRTHEIDLSIRLRKVLTLTVVFANSSDILAPGVTFAIFVIIAKYNDQTLNVSSAFTALSLIGLLTAPIGQLIFIIPQLLAAVGCFDRIQTFITSPGRQDHRLLNNPFDDQAGTNQLAPSPMTASDFQEIELREIKPTRPQPSETPSSIRVNNATFAWGDTEVPIVKDVTFEIAAGNLTLIIGPVGCGKSSLLKGLLGEIPSSKGFIHTDSLQSAFVDQTPWIQRKSIRDNILGASLFEQSWYSSVVHACALDKDIAALPSGDLTLVGSAGTSLSGGQKLRLVSNMIQSNL